LKRIITVAFVICLSVELVSCINEVQCEDPVATDPVATANVITEPEEEKPAEPIKEEIMLKPIAVYPAYIKDQCGTLWGIPASLMGEYDKNRITVETAEGVEVPQSELDIYTVSGTVYIVHRYSVQEAENDDGTAGSVTEYVDTYRQVKDTIELVESSPSKPEETRAVYDGLDWKIETTIVNGDTRSYLYSHNADLVNAMGNYSGKGAYIRWWKNITGFVVLDKGIVVMTSDGAYFVQWGRSSPEFVSEIGRLWK
jgi:hypothetical protein